MKPHTAAPPALTLAFLVGLGGPLRAQLPTTPADRWNRAAMEWVELLDSEDFAAAGDRVAPAVPD
ncbi:MAG: hypothetical protein KJO11_06330, partial [Gemmatimonadetes bacterium]|nr:hypothetical protein [Gemmatimonadota bacterium]